MKILTVLSIFLTLAPVLMADKPQQFSSTDQVPEGIVRSDWQSIRAAYEAARHQFFPQADGTHQAHNPGMGWQLTFDEKGFMARPQDGSWTWGLELVQKAAITAPRDEPHASQHEAPSYETECSSRGALRATFTRRHTTHLTEWFINDPRGLEQGWTLSAPADIRLRVRGNLKASVSPQGITFGGQITYSGLKAWDATGKAVPTHFETTGEGFAVCYDDTAARYPITIDPIAQEAYLKASNTDAGDNFGCSVAVSGDTVVVGAYDESSNATGVNGNQADNSASYSGAAYVFTRSGTVWTQQAYLKASNTGQADSFGWSVAVSGDTVVVGATAEASNATGVNGNQANNSASLAGAAYVFTRSGTVWTQQAYLKASNTETYDLFGISVAVSGDTVIVGAREDSNATGVNGNQADNSASDSGAAYVFTRSGTVWTQQAYLKASNTGLHSYFGVSVGVSGDTIVAGSHAENHGATGVNGNQADNSVNGPGSGAAYVFTRSGTVWTQQAYLKASNTGRDDYFGNSVAVSGDTVVVGAPDEDSNATGVNGNQGDNSASNSGAAYVFTRSGTVWTQHAYLKASNTGAGDYFGLSVAVSEDTVVAGTSFEDSDATGVNGTVNELAGDAGAAYVFLVTSPDIAVAQANPVTDGGSVAFGTTVVGTSSTPLTFSITNPGTADLASLAVTKDGVDASDFTVSALGDTNIPVGAGTVTFTVTFSPTTGGAKTAAIHIASNVSGTKNPFDIVLTGQPLTFTQDGDSDGMNDAAEFQLAALGFDWQVNQTSLVNTYYAGANGAGLYTPSQVQALNIGTPLLQRDALGQFKLTLGVEKSTTLLPGSFTFFPMTAPQTVINGAGKLEFQFTVPDNAAFFKVQAQ